MIEISATTALIISFIAGFMFRGMIEDIFRGKNA